MSKQITQAELESYLWGAAVLLRSKIDAGSYKQYIFPLLFFKRINDVYEEECQKAIAEFGDESAADFPEYHSFSMPKGYRWEDVRNTSENVGSALSTAFKKIENANLEKLSGIFGDGIWTNKNRFSDSLLKDLIEHFSQYTLSLANCPEDELGRAYEYLIKQFANDSGHTAQEFYTNRTVVHLMTEMLKPQSNESIYDPTCGTAGMLISCIAYLKEKGIEWRNVQLYGQEITDFTSCIARMNLFLHGCEQFEICNADTLKYPKFIENGSLKKFNMILANPPYSIKTWDRDAFASDKYGRCFLGLPPAGRADYAFIQHILKSMDEKNGRCAILLPHGVLFRRDEYEIRKNLIQNDLVECVIGLGPNLFFNSSMEACILICKSQKDEKIKNKIFFINALKEVERTGNESYLTENNIENITDCYKSFKDIKGFSKLVDIKEIEENEYSLQINLYASIDDKTVNKTEIKSVKDCIKTWEDISSNISNDIAQIDKLLEKSF
jgi:type I restriction enzyme M protein